VKKIIFTCLLFVLVLGVSAQTINLEQARVLGLANSRTLARYEMEIRSSILDERNQLYSMLPQISADYRLSMNYLQRDWEFVNPIDGFSAGTSLSITQIIFQGGKSFIQKAINEITTERIRKDALAEYFKVLNEVDNAYYAALEAGAAVEAEESLLQAAILGFSIAEIRHASGMINQGDYLEALANKETRENSRNQARRNLTLRMGRFRTLTGISGTVELEQIAFDKYESVILHLASISDEDAFLLFDEFWKILAADNPLLAKSVINNQRAEMNLRLTRREYTPTISATIFGTSLGYSTAEGFSSSGTGGLSIRGNIPVDFWVMRNRVEKSRIARDITALEHTNAEASMEQDLLDALFSLFSQAGDVLSSRRSLEYNERRFEFVMERYRLLQSSVSELTNAASDLINSRNSLNKASYSFLQRLSALRSLCALNDEGRLLEILMMGSE
jgi:outer membrane protein TolC